MPQIPVKAIAEQKFRDADGWRIAFGDSARRYHGLVLLWILRRCAFAECMRGRRIGDNQLTHLSILIDEAHDFALVEFENMRTAARNASRAELDGRFFYEEHEEIAR